jgi:hypothetical protein
MQGFGFLHSRSGFKTSDQVSRLNAGLHVLILQINVCIKTRRRPIEKAQMGMCEHLSEAVLHLIA